MIGYTFPQRATDLTRLLTVYCVVNGVALIGGVAEYMELGWPALGGIDMTWIRNRSGYVVELMSGFYRSPDILGMHAAGVCLFASVLSIMAPRGKRLAWVCSSSLGGGLVLLLLCGRRKMIGIPFVFGVVFLVMTACRTRRVSQAMWYVLVGAACVMLVVAITANMGVSGVYSEYAATMLNETAIRGKTSLVAAPLDNAVSVRCAWARSGYWRLKVHIIWAGGGMTWQEDGSSRAMVELGIPGVLLLLVAAWNVVLEMRTSSRKTHSRIDSISGAGWYGGRSGCQHRELLYLAPSLQR